MVVDAAQQRAREDVAGRAAAGDPPALQHHDPVGPGGGEGEVVQHHDDGVTRPGARARLREHVLLVPDVEGRGGLVEQQQARRLREDARERRTRLLPAGQRREPALGQVQDVGGEERTGDDRVVVLGLLRAGDAGAGPGRATHPDDVDHTEREAQGLLLQEHGAASGELGDREGRERLGSQELLTQRVHVSGVPGDGRERGHPRERARGGRDVAGEHPEQRGLAGAVRPDEREDLPGAHLEVDPVEDGVPVDRVPDAAREQDGGAHAHPPAVRRVRRSSQKKNGPPTSAVSIPIGRSA